MDQRFKFIKIEEIQLVKCKIGVCFYNLGVDKTFHTKTQRKAKTTRVVKKEKGK